MNKLQKICLFIMIVACLDFAFDVLLDMSFILRYLPTNSIWIEVYAFLIGVCSFVNITIFNKD